MVIDTECPECKAHVTVEILIDGPMQLVGHLQIELICERCSTHWLDLHEVDP